MQNRFLTLFVITLSCCLLSFLNKAQTSVSPGDMAVIGFKTNNNTQSGNDAVKFVTLIDLACGTVFIATDNNWRNNGSWYCSNDEFAYEITVTSQIDAGSVFYLDPDAGNVTVSSGAVSFTDLGSPWGTNTGFNSKGDNFFLLQGTRATPQFIYGFRHKGSFASGGDCGSKNNTSLPASLTLGFSAIEMSSDEDQWHYDCPNELVSGTKAQLIASISNNSNWTDNGGQSWNNSTCDFFVTDAPISGIIGVSGAGCGCLAGCNLSSFGGPNCGTGISGNCVSGYQAMSVDIPVPSGCTYSVTATMRNYNGCSSSGADGSGGDKLKVDNISGGKSFQIGASNANIEDQFSLIGPGTIRVSGEANRADEIITYKITPIYSGSCSSCLISPLSVELTEFHGIKANKSVKLNWTTATETNNDYFTVERSSEAENWEIISIVNGSGNSITPISYNIWDSSPLEGRIYYRLKQTDYDGRVYYSKVITVNFDENGAKNIVKTLNLLGQEVEDGYKGIVINLYSNGESEKVYRN